MKKLLIFITIFISCSAFAQNAKLSHKISMGFSFSPDYNFRTLKNTDGTGNADFVLNVRNGMEIPKFGFTTGFNICFHFSNSFGYETGIQFLNKGYKTKEQNLISAQPDPSLPNTASFNYSYQYIGIPLNARFAIGKNKVRFVSSFGFIVNFLTNLKQSNFYKYDDGRSETKSQSSTSGINAIDISPQISLGFDYKISNKINLSVAPIFRYGLIKTHDSIINEKLWSAGLAFGIYYHLK